jgi:anthranilate synthase component II
MRILLLDNYDSFTWNLQHLLEPFAEVNVVRNDGISVQDAAVYDRIVLSPGPGLPSEAGIMPELLAKLIPTHPILGICLGMQAIAEACGGRLFNQPEVQHGVVAHCTSTRPVDPLFHGIEQPFDIGLYHSWAVDPDALPTDLQAIAHSEKGVIMALRHMRYNTCGLQFHPESVMTSVGPRIIANWINL